jgi:hypothetical protein
MHGPRTPSLDAPPLQRYGLPQLVYAASPAVATDFTVQVTGGKFVRLVSVFCNLDTDSNAAAREVTLEYRDSAGRVFCSTGAPVTVSADSANDYVFSAFQPEAVWPIDTRIVVPLSPILLTPTWTWALHIVNAQVGDQLSAVRYVEELFYTEGEPPG